MNSNYNFERAAIDDIESIISLRVALLKEVGEIKSTKEEQIIMSSTRKYLEETFTNNEFISYVAKFKGEAVSISGMVIYKRPPYITNLNGIEAYLLNMYTLPNHRGKGLARELIECCLEECKRKNVKRIWLHSSEDGKYLYKKMGFSYNDTEMELFLK
ncbi:GNAT family N-acetyltransferase [Oceanobacillus oncorhynchi]|uniref:GNAT family N-acetyltransferase n=1 Tax=Oceanobacillus oncorhynchi TaxID=545501 RepID=UPI00186698CD|nr:GNAT family N-acetyltransferase [Oceanobacillus oncorhynchi]